MKFLLSSFCFLAFTSIAYATPLSSWEQRSFWASFVTSCNDNMKRTSSMNVKQRNAWCECVGYEMVKMLTKEDFNKNNYPASINQKAPGASKICEQKLINTNILSGMR